MALLLNTANFSPEPWIAAIKAVDPSIEVITTANVDEPDSITVAALWRYQHGELLQYRNLRAILSLGAGVEHIISDPELPKDVPIARVVDPYLTRDMTQFVVLATLTHLRFFDLYQQRQLQKHWEKTLPGDEATVGVMGLGQLGSDAALKLRALGLQVRGWSRSEKNIEGITCFHGQDQLPEFLSACEVLICLLPLTQQTENILNADLFAKLPKGAYVINISRGQHLVDDDLLSALDSEHLSGACLDVFHQEPLPTDHPFWTHPNIRVTPHIASVTNPRSVAKLVVENYHRSIACKPLLNQVDMNRGY